MQVRNKQNTSNKCQKSKKNSSQTWWRLFWQNAYILKSRLSVSNYESRVTVSDFLMKSRSRLEILTRSRSRRLRSRLHHWLLDFLHLWRNRYKRFPFYFSPSRSDIWTSQPICDARDITYLPFTSEISIGLDRIRAMTNFVEFGSDPVSSEISDLCEISELLLFVSYFASQNKSLKFRNYFFNVWCVN